MPAKSDHETFYKDYVVTHGCYTILGSHSMLADAEAQLASVDDVFVKDELRPQILDEVHTYMPGFSERFKYKGWKGHVCAKLKTQSEFRSAIVYEKSNIVYMFPGKINNIFEAADEVLSLLQNKDLMEESGVKWARGGMIQRAKSEIEQHPGEGDNSTVNLQICQNLIAAEAEPRNGAIST
ncbi:hypothetical protein MMC10_010317 [Thelotrema lepadinum]|nr:hypothetical protein [Thelotrema lepadinum]